MAVSRQLTQLWLLMVASVGFAPPSLAENVNVRFSGDISGASGPVPGGVTVGTSFAGSLSYPTVGVFPDRSFPPGVLTGSDTRLVLQAADGAFIGDAGEAPFAYWYDVTFVDPNDPDVEVPPDFPDAAVAVSWNVAGPIRSSDGGAGYFLFEGEPRIFEDEIPEFLRLPTNPPGTSREAATFMTGMSISIGNASEMPDPPSSSACGEGASGFCIFGEIANASSEPSVDPFSALSPSIVCTAPHVSANQMRYAYYPSVKTPNDSGKCDVFCNQIARQCRQAVRSNFHCFLRFATPARSLGRILCGEQDFDERLRCNEARLQARVESMSRWRTLKAEGIDTCDGLHSVCLDRCIAQSQLPPSPLPTRWNFHSQLIFLLPISQDESPP